MVFRQESDEVFATMRILHCFEYVSVEYRANLFPDDFLWPVAFQWLAICVVRSFIKPEEMYEAIALTGVLGKLDVHLFKQRVKELDFPVIPLTWTGKNPQVLAFGYRMVWGTTKGHGKTRFPKHCSSIKRSSIPLIAFSKSP